jgi:hypothetical protein
MMGYGARTGSATAIHDVLMARALYLRAAGQDLLIVSCDLCLMSPGQAGELRSRLEAATGVPRQRILVGCIHTHSGPETGLLDALAGRDAAPEVVALFDAVVTAGERAVAGAAPAALGIGHGRAGIGRNRRVADGPVDPDVLVIRVESVEPAPRIDPPGGATSAILYLYACHPTVLGPENLAFSADWPGAAARRIAEHFPGTNPIFLLGSHADVDPRTRGLQDLARTDRSRGAGFSAVAELGTELGDAVAEAAARATLRREIRLGGATGGVELACHQPDDADRRAAALALGLEPDAELRTRDLFRLESERTRDLPAPLRRERIAQLRRYARGRMAQRFASGPRCRVEVQLLQIDRARLLALPAEATVEVGRDWRRRMGSPDAAVISIGNGWLRYLPHRRNFEEPMSHQMYEILTSTFPADAAERLLDEAERLAGQLESGSEAGATR